MERSDGVSVVLDSIMKMMDRSSDRLLRSFNRFDGSDIRVTASPRAPVPAAVPSSHQSPAAPSGLSPGEQFPTLPQPGRLSSLRSQLSMRSSRATSRKPA
jgi:hypothetical protein